MALDILVNDYHDNQEKSISLYLDEYDNIMKRIESLDDFELIKKAISDYYGEYEIYLNELDNIKVEAQELKELFQSYDSKALQNFIDEFLNLIDFAIRHHQTIKFIGD